jgi:hypothetical protein
VWEAPPPVLLNTWKHHAGALRFRIHETTDAGPAALKDLANNLVVIGTVLMDLYLGELSPFEIGKSVMTLLHGDNRLSLDSFRPWIESNRGYRTVTLPEDGSQWVLRLGDESDRYLHVHPARWAPKTCRVKANVLKTAILILAYTGIHGGDPRDVALVNRVRRDYLELAPLGRELDDDQGIGQIIQLLQARDGT